MNEGGRESSQALGATILLQSCFLASAYVKFVPLNGKIHVWRPQICIGSIRMAPGETTITLSQETIPPDVKKHQSQ